MMRQLGWIGVLGLLAVGCASTNSDQGDHAPGPRMSKLHNFAFEGKWHVHVVPDDSAAAAGESPFDDTLTFKDGVFTSQACSRADLDSANYTVSSLEGRNQFSASMTLDSKQSCSWSGYIVASNITGVVLWNKHWSKGYSYHFEGSR